MEFKEAYRIFWMTKGHIDSSHSTIMAMAPGYFKRLWYNEEAYIYEEGFEEAWRRVSCERGIR